MISLSYLICSTMRSGSTLLTDGLIETGVAGRPLEFFDKQHHGQWINVLQSTSDADFFAKVLKYGTSGNGVFGAKVHWVQIKNMAKIIDRPDAFLPDGTHDYLKDVFPNLHYIHLYREDTVRQAVSLFKAINTQKWWDREGEPLSGTYELSPDAFNFAEIDALVHEMANREQKWWRYFKQRSIEPFTIKYEHFEDNYESTILQVLDYLKLEPPAGFKLSPPKLKKQADLLSEEWVRKYRTMRGF
jgi:hypothetical protein